MVRRKKIGRRKTQKGNGLGIRPVDQRYLLAHHALKLARSGVNLKYDGTKTVTIFSM